MLFPGVDKGDFPHLKRWFDKIHARPAVKKGLEVPHKGDLIDRMNIEYNEAMSEANETIRKAKAAAGK